LGSISAFLASEIVAGFFAQAILEISNFGSLGPMSRAAAAPAKKWPRPDDLVRVSQGPAPL
jgi:hypothetical protein